MNITEIINKSFQYLLLDFETQGYTNYQYLEYRVTLQAKIRESVRKKHSIFKTVFILIRLMFAINEFFCLGYIL